MPLSRRVFLRWSLGWAAGAPWAIAFGDGIAAGASTPAPLPGTLATPSANPSRVAIVRCPSYGAEVDKALRTSFDLLGGIGSLVRGKTVTVKMNLTGTIFGRVLGRTAGETFMTHYATVRALSAALFEAGATRVRFVESTNSRAPFETTLEQAGWDLGELRALGKVQFEDTRNLGSAKSYVHLQVPGRGYLFESFDFNHCYGETDVMVSLCKLKQHLTAGVTLSIKNQFGLTPNSLYGDQAPNEEATGGRGPFHDPPPAGLKVPGFRAGAKSPDPTLVPRAIVDICAARPIHLAIIDGIMSISGAELPWAGVKLVDPRVLIAGFNPVSTDAVGTAVMGFANPRAPKGTVPFKNCENHLLLAEQAGLGTADLKKIEIVGTPLEKARYPYPQS